METSAKTDLHVTDLFLAIGVMSVFSTCSM